MGRAGNSGKKTAKGSSSAQNNGGDMILVDPSRVRFQHSRIRPYFSGCGRSVTETLESIRRKELAPEDLPPIQVIVGPETGDDDGPWYFSLNNRRLWVLKRCREEGLLENNQIAVRVRPPKSSAEASRYTLENCSIDAKITTEFESRKKRVNGAAKVDSIKPTVVEKNATEFELNDDQEEESDSDDSDDGGLMIASNRFSALS